MGQTYIEFNKSKEFKTKTLFKCALATFIFATTIVQLKVFAEMFPSAQLYEGVLFVVIMLSYPGTLYVSYFKSAEARKLFNSLVDLEQQLSHGKVYSKILINCHYSNIYVLKFKLVKINISRFAVKIYRTIFCLLLAWSLRQAVENGFFRIIMI